MYVDLVVKHDKNPIRDTSRDALYLFVALFVAFTTTGILSAQISEDDVDNNSLSVNIYQNIKVSEDRQFMEAENDLNSVDVDLDSHLQQLDSSISQ